MVTEEKGDGFHASQNIFIQLSTELTSTDPNAFVPRVPKLKNDQLVGFAAVVVPRAAVSATADLAVTERAALGAWATVSRYGGRQAHW